MTYIISYIPSEVKMFILPKAILSSTVRKNIHGTGLESASGHPFIPVFIL